MEEWREAPEPPPDPDQPFGRRMVYSSSSVLERVAIAQAALVRARRRLRHRSIQSAMQIPHASHAHDNIIKTFISRAGGDQRTGGANEAAAVTLRACYGY